LIEHGRATKATRPEKPQKPQKPQSQSQAGKQKKQKHSIPKKNKSLSINDGYASLKIDKE
jgi:hypothetical protein